MRYRAIDRLIQPIVRPVGSILSALCLLDDPDLPLLRAAIIVEINVSLPKFPFPCPRTQSLWEFLLSVRETHCKSYELSRLSHVANLRKEIGASLDLWMEGNS
jgi:hypothetical protein